MLAWTHLERARSNRWLACHAPPSDAQRNGDETSFRKTAGIRTSPAIDLLGAESATAVLLAASRAAASAFERPACGDRPRPPARSVSRAVWLLRRSYSWRARSASR